MSKKPTMREVTYVRAHLIAIEGEMALLASRTRSSSRYAPDSGGTDRFYLRK